MKHFEQIWELSESTTKQYYEDPLNIVVGKIKSQLDHLISTNDQNEKIVAMGKILLDISFLSEKLNINVFAAMKNELEELKINLFDPEP